MKTGFTSRSHRHRTIQQPQHKFLKKRARPQFNQNNYKTSKHHYKHHQGMSFKNMLLGQNLVDLRNQRREYTFQTR